jgi:hypothetical protein
VRWSTRVAQALAKIRRIDWVSHLMVGYFLILGRLGFIASMIVVVLSPLS